MILRALTLAGGVAGAAVTSQFPEYSQQYLQRLGGAVDALHEVVADFDASAQAVGLSRSDALAQMTGTAFMERRRAEIAEAIAKVDQGKGVIGLDGRMVERLHLVEATRLIALRDAIAHRT